ncbi:MAG: D-alanyl-D-alanine carboxypeptidase [Ferruginibacter sp.]|nr:D-alanyl-D-alanine carboxypeptidase [Ferruginibacter sp.]
MVIQRINHYTADTGTAGNDHNHRSIALAGFKSILAAMFLLAGLVLLLTSCSTSKQISKLATKILLKDSAISTGHTGISIYEPATNQYWYNYNATKYFIPASNTKLFSLYAGMKYLGDSIAGLRYEIDTDSSLRIQPTGDPTFLHPEYLSQPVFDLLSHFKRITFTNAVFTDNFMGRGWAWDDYKEAYMTQRSNFPVYGNLTSIKKTGNTVSIIPGSQKYFIPEHTSLEKGFDFQKKWDDNLITLTDGTNQRLSVPFNPNALDIIEMLQDTLHAAILPDADDKRPLKNIVYSQPSDSLFKPMMHRSDNFFAEQTLLMAGNERLGYMRVEKMIDTLLDTDLKDIPQKPKWVDGSGLSRYNLFTPQSFVYILNKMKNEFGMGRLENILPTGGEGTLAAYYKKEAGFIFAKTGTLSNNCALSGYLITKKNKFLIFSILSNNYITGATPVRKAVEQFLQNIRTMY